MRTGFRLFWVENDIFKFPRSDICEGALKVFFRRLVCGAFGVAVKVRVN